MSFDIERAKQDEAFWNRFTRKYGKKLQEQGWQGPILPEQLAVDTNWDVFDDVLNDAVHCDGLEKTFAESDGGGIPGSADFASVKTLCGRFFVTGSYMDGGPYKTLEDAMAAAGLDGDAEIEDLDD